MNKSSCTNYTTQIIRNKSERLKLSSCSLMQKCIRSLKKWAILSFQPELYLQHIPSLPWSNNENITSVYCLKKKKKISSNFQASACFSLFAVKCLWALRESNPIKILSYFDCQYRSTGNIETCIIEAKRLLLFDVVWHGYYLLKVLKTNFGDRIYNTQHPLTWQERFRLTQEALMWLNVVLIITKPQNSLFHARWIETKTGKQN